MTAKRAQPLHPQHHDLPTIDDRVQLFYERELANAPITNPALPRDWENCGYRKVRVPAPVAHEMEEHPELCGVAAEKPFLNARFLYHCMIRKRQSLAADGLFKGEPRQNHRGVGRPAKPPEAVRDIREHNPNPREKRGTNYGLGPAVPVESREELDELVICALVCHFKWKDEARDSMVEDSVIQSRLRTKAQRALEFAETVPGVHRDPDEPTAFDLVKSDMREMMTTREFTYEYNRARTLRAMPVYPHFGWRSAEWREHLEELKDAAWARYCKHLGGDPLSEVPIPIPVRLVDYAYIWASAPDAQSKNIWRRIVDAYENSSNARKGPYLNVNSEEVEELLVIADHKVTECVQSAFADSADYGAWYRFQRQLYGLSSFWSASDLDT